MCCPTPGAPGCSFLTWPCTSLFGMTTRWWPYSACLLGTYDGYCAGGCHLPCYFLIGPTDWSSAAASAPLPSHFLGTDTFINGLLHASFSAMWTIMVTGRQTLSRSIYLACTASGKNLFLKCLQLSSSTPQTHAQDNHPPHFIPAHPCIVTQIALRPCPIFCGALFMNNIFRNNE